MVRLENSKNDITYELVDDKGELTEKDKKKIFKLVKKIEEGKGIAEKFKKSGYNT